VLLCQVNESVDSTLRVNPPADYVVAKLKLHTAKKWKAQERGGEYQSEKKGGNEGEVGGGTK
jgi:hypothetical protein